MRTTQNEINNLGNLEQMVSAINGSAPRFLQELRSCNCLADVLTELKEFLNNSNFWSFAEKNLSNKDSINEFFSSLANFIQTNTTLSCKKDDTLVHELIKTIIMTAFREFLDKTDINQLMLNEKSIFHTIKDNFDSKQSLEAKSTEIAKELQFVIRRLLIKLSTENDETVRNAIISSIANHVLFLQSCLDVLSDDINKALSKNESFQPDESSLKGQCFKYIRRLWGLCNKDEKDNRVLT
ncbi:MAG: hypothetical protein JO149_03735, partial [Gammaproteobacteria bacterium]|nr:hypothetical protein [Gammaproteobacteria bacterium]